MSRRALAALLLFACGDDAHVTPASSTDAGRGDGAIARDREAGVTPSVKRACVADPVGAVNGLSERGSLLGFHLNGFEDPSTTRHWEGVTRLEGDATRFLAVSRIGTEMFDIVEMASRAADGEAFGASRGDEDTAPPARDEIVAKIDQDDGFDHAGGMQTLGHVLAVPLENGKISRVVFYDVGAPKAPKRLTTLERPDLGEAGTAGLAALPDGRTLLVVGRKGNQTLDVYTTRASDLTGFTLDATWGVKADGVKTTLPDDDATFGDYQNMNVLRACDDTLYLLGTHREGVLVGADFVDLFRLELGAAKPVITKVAKRHVYCSRSGQPAQCNLDAAAGAYVTPSGALHVYATEHDNDGPGGSIKMKEF